jgi:isoleucyl-tRNA synthetase
MWKASPIEPLNFSTKELMSRPFQVISTLYHLHLYFKQNSEYDKFDSKSSTIQWAKQNNLLTQPDIWLLSKLQRMIQKTTQCNDSCKFHESAKAVEDFLINSLSQIYIPITKSELWAEDETKKDRRFTIYAILAETLKVLDILIHPFSPFTSEYLYLNIFGNKENILLEQWPKIDDSLTNEKIEKSFDLMKEIVSISSAARMKGKLKRRWPLENALICVGKGQKEILESLSELLKTQINIEKFEIFETENQDGLKQFIELKKLGLPVVPKIELERKTVGPKAKQDMGKLLQIFAETDPNEIIDSLVEANSHTFNVGSNKIILSDEDFVIDFEADSDYQFANRGNLVVILSVKRNQEMMAKGLVKDLARRLQTLRKERGYNPTDILNRASILDLEQESFELIKSKVDEIAFLVRVKQVNFDESCNEYKNDDIDGQKIRISVE